MTEDTSPLKQFFPIIVQNYIRATVAAKIIEHQDSGKEGLPDIKFSILGEYYQQIVDCEIHAPQMGLKYEYDEENNMLQVIPEQYFVDLYQNKIMRDVAMKQFQENVERHINFITLISE